MDTLTEIFTQIGLENPYFGMTHELLGTPGVLILCGMVLALAILGINRVRTNIKRKRQRQEFQDALDESRGDFSIAPDEDYEPLVIRANPEVSADPEIHTLNFEEEDLDDDEVARPLFPEEQEALKLDEDDAELKVGAEPKVGEEPEVEAEEEPETVEPSNPEPEIPEAVTPQAETTEDPAPMTPVDDPAPVPQAEPETAEQPEQAGQKEELTPTAAPMVEEELKEAGILDSLDADNDSEKDESEEDSILDSIEKEFRAIEKELETIAPSQPQDSVDPSRDEIEQMLKEEAEEVEEEPAQSLEEILGDIDDPEIEKLKQEMQETIESLSEQLDPSFREDEHFESEAPETAQVEGPPDLPAEENDEDALYIEQLKLFQENLEQQFDPASAKDAESEVLFPDWLPQVNSASVESDSLKSTGIDPANLESDSLSQVESFLFTEDQHRRVETP